MCFGLVIDFQGRPRYIGPPFTSTQNPIIQKSELGAGRMRGNISDLNPECASIARLVCLLVGEEETFVNVGPDFIWQTQKR